VIGSSPATSWEPLPKSSVAHGRSIGPESSLYTHSTIDLPQGMPEECLRCLCGGLRVMNKELEISRPSRAGTSLNPSDRRMTFASGCEPIPLETLISPSPVGGSAPKRGLGSSCWPGFFRPGFLIQAMAIDDVVVTQVCLAGFSAAFPGRQAVRLRHEHPPVPCFRGSRSTRL